MGFLAQVLQDYPEVLIIDKVPVPLHLYSPHCKKGPASKLLNFLNRKKNLTDRLQYEGEAV